MVKIKAASILREQKITSEVNVHRLKPVACVDFMFCIHSQEL
jgi:hypothetical protein